MIDGFIRTMETEKGYCGPLNLGNPVEFSIAELADRIVTLCGGSSKIVYRPLPQDDPKQRQPDISQARQTLGWAPKVPLDDGLKSTIAYFRRVLA